MNRGGGVLWVATNLDGFIQVKEGFYQMPVCRGSMRIYTMGGTDRRHGQNSLEVHNYVQCGKVLRWSIQNSENIYNYVCMSLGKPKIGTDKWQLSFERPLG